MTRQRDIAKLRSYSRKHYQNNRPAMIARARQTTLEARERVRRWLLEYLLEHPCVDCGEPDPIVLEFDHREGKEFAIGTVIGRGLGLRRVASEVAKCDVRCANCHRKKTYRERGFTHRG